MKKSKNSTQVERRPLKRPDYAHTAMLLSAAAGVSKIAMQEAKALNLTVVFMKDGILMERLPSGTVRKKVK